jgi:hypothetical protein
MSDDFSRCRMTKKLPMCAADPAIAENERLAVGAGFTIKIVEYVPVHYIVSGPLVKKDHPFASRWLSHSSFVAFAVTFFHVPRIHSRMPTFGVLHG